MILQAIKDNGPESSEFVIRKVEVCIFICLKFQNIQMLALRFKLFYFIEDTGKTPRSRNERFGQIVPGRTAGRY